MITKITGQLVALQDNTLSLRIDAFEYEILIPEFTRRHLQQQIGQHRRACLRIQRAMLLSCTAQAHVASQGSRGNSQLGLHVQDNGWTPEQLTETLAHFSIVRYS